MPVSRKITEPDGVYFITITCHQWLPLIEQKKGYDLVYNWFDHLKGRGHYINGYVIMPNHLHVLIAFLTPSPRQTHKTRCETRLRNRFFDYPKNEK